MSSPLSSDRAIEELLREPSRYRTPEALRELAQQVSVDSPGNVTVLYSGGVTDRVSSWQIVKAMEDAVVSQFELATAPDLLNGLEAGPTVGLGGG